MRSAVAEEKLLTLLIGDIVHGNSTAVFVAGALLFGNTRKDVSGVIIALQVEQTFSMALLSQSLTVYEMDHMAVFC